MNDDERLHELLQQIDTLTDTDWREFHRVIHRVLKRIAASRPESVAESKDDYIDMFIADRLFPQTEKLKNRPLNRAYLVTMFRNYMTDHLRQEPASGSMVSIDAATDLDTPGGGAWGEPPGVQTTRQAGALEAMEDLLHEHGLHVTTVSEEAHRFLRAEGQWAQLQPELWWIRPYLRAHYCDKALALSTLARQLDIPAYDYKARKLGITYRKNGFAQLTEFQATYLGQWITHCGIDLTDEDATDLVFAALSLLCAACFEASPELPVAPQVDG